MSSLLITAIVCMVSALTVYSIGIWSVRISGRLKIWQAALFWIGLVFDVTGTVIMAQMAGKMGFDVHGITGVLAIMLMLGNAIWAVVVLTSKKEGILRNYRQFSLIVWIIWLVSFFTGLFGAMSK